MSSLTNVLDSIVGAGRAAPARVSTPWRAPLAASCAIAAAAHIPVTGEHLREAPYIGALFILLEIASTMLAVVILARPARVVFVAISIVGTLAVIALVVSRTLGLPLIGDDVGNWTEPLAVVSFAAEAVMAFGGAAAALERGRTNDRSARFGLVTGLLILILGAAATGLAAASESEGGDSSGRSMSGMHMGLPAASGPNEDSTGPA